MTVDQDNRWDIRNWGHYTKLFLQHRWPYCIGLLILVIVVQSLGMVNLNKQLRLQRHGTYKKWNWQGDKRDPLDQNGLSLWQQGPFADDLFNCPFDANTWDPFQEMQHMQERMDSMFGEAFGRFSRSSEFGDLFDAGSFTPHIDIQDQGDCLVVIIDLPGAEEPNVNITCTETELTVSGTLADQQEDHDKGNLLRKERSSGRFSRTIPLPVPVQSGKMQTEFDKGIVTVTIPKKP